MILACSSFASGEPLPHEGGADPAMTELFEQLKGESVARSTYQRCDAIDVSSTREADPLEPDLCR